MPGLYRAPFGRGDGWQGPSAGHMRVTEDAAKQLCQSVCRMLKGPPRCVDRVLCACIQPSSMLGKLAVKKIAFAIRTTVGHETSMRFLRLSKNGDHGVNSGQV